VLDVIIERAPRTLVLFVTATVVAFYFGFLGGKLLAWKRGGLFEYTATLGGVFLFTVFTPWFALMMIWLFAFSLKLFPIGKFIDPLLWRQAPAEIEAGAVFVQMIWTSVIASAFLLVWLLIARRLEAPSRGNFRWLGVGLTVAGVIVYWAFFTNGSGRFALDILHHLTLPVLTVALISFAGTMLLTRNSMLETLGEDYVMAARAKGLPEAVIRDKHAARNALLPVVTSLIFNLAFALDGGIVTETVFSWPGMGLTLLDAAQKEDIPMAIGALVFTGALVLIAHLVADVMYAYLDPRIRYN
jgi:peptide/nickel transport system permease protein